MAKGKPDLYKYIQNMSAEIHMLRANREDDKDGTFSEETDSWYVKPSIARIRRQRGSCSHICWRAECDIER